MQSSAPTSPTLAAALPDDAWLPLDAASASAIPLYDVASVRHIEAAALASLPAFALMSRAGAAAAAWLAHHAPAGPLLLLAGPGNNGGDALVAATRLHQAGRQVQVWLTAEPDRLPADAARAWLEARAAGVILHAMPESACHGTLPPFPPDTCALVDGLFGIGLNRAADGFTAQWIAHLAESRLPVFSLDIPSGLFADTGAGAPAVRALRTLTFIGAKPGLLTLDGRDCAGEVDIAPLGLLYPPAQSACATVSVPASFASALPARRHATNKGTFGSLAVIGGGIGMTGAPLLGARAAQHLGAGRVHIAFLAQPAPLIDPVHPELMLHPIAEIELTNMSALVIGPGMGTGTAARKQLAQLLQASVAATEPPALVLDADALNLLAADPALAAMLGGGPPVRVMTPHPLEAARLSGISVAEIQRDRLAAARSLAAQWQAVVVLKGSGTVIASPPDALGSVSLSINPTGNAGLATAGTGDVLAGMIGALLAQGMPALQAAQAAVWLHGRAADHLVAQGTGPAGLTASELYLPVRDLFNALLRARQA
ncbi:bifunctional ADP-dependent NAD(P)H-hydrate dehydratase/NAD(P)H-hydrate epimerase [Cupriavidus basilensis]|uniref:Bifunctional NAD(P)H-hydrate repair enzyme n=1 Tax=Cupriavidus basilensis TaxID=68895 RepID=A0A0C4Y288_9BURK|nr:bifunctional ADP-dependent NAD(P)H-hydrate dehydratase/NAD(P)H-hydrate epimerase [Cupriavidus basilensis]AJG19217.1 NAD(P)HX epimerase [Cupriavidus basilensis]